MGMVRSGLYITQSDDREQPDGLCLDVRDFSKLRIEVYRANPLWSAVEPANHCPMIRLVDINLHAGDTPASSLQGVRQADEILVHRPTPSE